MWIVIVGEMLYAALQMAGPVLALVFLIHCFVAVITKLAPQMNIFFSLGMILTMVAGLWMVYVIMPQQARDALRLGRCRHRACTRDHR